MIKRKKDAFDSREEHKKSPMLVFCAMSALESIELVNYFLICAWGVDKYKRGPVY